MELELDDDDLRSQEATTLRALVSPALGPRDATALAAMAMERRGGPATLALAARLALDRVRRPSWLRGLLNGLAAAPRPELWASLTLAADACIAGAARALTHGASEAAAGFLAGCLDGRARLLGIACAGSIDGGARAIVDAIDAGRGGFLSAAERVALEELERGLVARATQVLQV